MVGDASDFGARLRASFTGAFGFGVLLIGAMVAAGLVVFAGQTSGLAAGVVRVLGAPAWILVIPVAFIGARTFAKRALTSAAKACASLGCIGAVIMLWRLGVFGSLLVLHVSPDQPGVVMGCVVASVFGCWRLWRFGVPTPATGHA